MIHLILQYKQDVLADWTALLIGNLATQMQQKYIIASSDNNFVFIYIIHK